MKPDALSNVDRRDFLKLAGAATACRVSHRAFAAPSERCTLIVDPANAAASSGPAKRAAGQLRHSLAAKGVTCEIASSSGAAAGASLCIAVSGPESQLARGFPKGASLTAAESLRLSSGKAGRTPALLVSGGDVRGYVYGLLELADRVRYSSSPVEDLRLAAVVEEKPANEVRCVSRYFCSELEDKSWYYDKAFWTGYLDSIAANRFNRFTMAYGLEYDFPRGVTDDYLHFPYPYLVDVPGYPGVRVMQLAAPDGTRLPTPLPVSKAERDRNFQMLRFIAAETGARGLHFQLGIWTHAYQWTDSPNAYHQIEGLTPETHAGYCRDALAVILKECEEIQGLTLRVHGESGIPEGSYPFWKTVFEAISGAGREIEIDMHAKGVNQTMIDIATATEMPVKLGAKYSAEHQSLGYQQADIRALEIPHANLTKTESALFSLSSGSRLFTRYGYGDFLHQGARYRLLFRSWPGTQRHLLSVDPEMAAAYSRSASFCGAAGLDLMEPLTFKGREGSGVAGGRCAYADASLDPKADWQKYEYYYRVWGRKLYDPDADAEVVAQVPSLRLRRRRHCHRILACQRQPHPASAYFGASGFGEQSRSVVRNADQHADRAGQRTFTVRRHTYPQNLCNGKSAGPSDVLDRRRVHGGFACGSIQREVLARLRWRNGSRIALRPRVRLWTKHAAEAARALRLSSGASKRMSLSRLAWEPFLRTSCAARCCLRSGSRPAMLRRAHWRPRSIRRQEMHGQRWPRARLASIDRTFLTVACPSGAVTGATVWPASIPIWQRCTPKYRGRPAVTPAGQNIAKAMRAATNRTSRPGAQCAHTPPDLFQPGQPLSLSLGIAPPSGGLSSIRLCYRHVNQAERWKSAPMSGQDGPFFGSDSGRIHRFRIPVAVLLRAEGRGRFRVVIPRL